MKVWIDGQILEGRDARVPVTDHGLLYGDGVFEGIRARGGRVFRLDAHLERLAVSMRALALELPGGVASLRDVVLETLRALGRPDVYVRLIVTRGEGALGVDPRSCPTPRVICIVDEVALYPAEKLARGISLRTVSNRRPAPDVLDPRVKSLNYLSNVIAKQEATAAGADEALMLNAAGHIAEAAVGNIFALKGDRLMTPCVTDGALEGITRAALLELAPDLGLEPRERSLDRVDLLGADEVMLTGTGAGIVGVRELDGRTIGAGVSGAMTEKLRVAFLELARRDAVSFAG